MPTELSRVPDAPLDVQYGNLRLNANDIVDASKVREAEKKPFFSGPTLPYPPPPTQA